MARKTIIQNLPWSKHQKSQGSAPKANPIHIRKLLFSILIIVLPNIISQAKTNMDFGPNYPNRIMDYYTLTQACDQSNPNFITVTRADGSTSGITFTWQQNGNIDPNYSIGLNPLIVYIPTNNKPLDLNYYKDGEYSVKITDQDKGITVILPFSVWGTRLQYASNNSCEEEKTIIEWNGLVIFKQAMLDNNAWNMRLWETHRFYSTANFYGVSLLVREYSKVQVLSGYKAFNRIVLDEFSNFKALKGVTLTSSCNMWGGIFVEDQCDITLEGTPGDRIELSNANTGVFVYEEYLDVEDPEEIFPESSDAFPFCWHNNQSPNFEDGPTGCSRSQVKFNYVNLWGVKPNVRKTNVGKVA